MRLVHRRARALLALAVASAACLTGGPAHAQGAVRLTLQGQTPWSTLYRDPTLHVSVIATNGSSATLRHLSVDLAFGPSYVSRLEYESSLTGGPSETIATISTSFPKIKLRPGDARTFAVRTDLSQISQIDQTDSRVYPVRVDLRSGRTVLASLVTPALYFVRPPEGTMLIASWLELAGPIAFGADGRLVDPSFEAALAPGTGQYRAPVDALIARQARTSNGVPIDLVPEPALVEQAQRMAGGYERADGTRVAAGEGAAGSAAGFLADLQTLMNDPDVETVSGPFSGPSIPAMVASGLGQDLALQREEGATTLRSVSDVPLASDVMRPPAGALSDPALDWLGDNGVHVVLGDADTVDRPPQTLDFAPPPTATVTTAGGTPVTLILPDPGAQGLLTRPDLLTDPVRTAQALLGELAVIWKEEPVPPEPNVRGVALALPSSLPPNVWAPLFDRLPSAPFLRPVRAADLVAGVAPQGAEAVLRTPSTAAFPVPYAESIRDLGRQVDAYASMLTQQSSVPTELDRDLMYAASAQYVDDPSAGQQWLDAVAAATAVAFDSVVPRVNHTFTFTSGEGTIPLLLGDPGTIPLRVTIQLRSAQFEFPDGAQREIVLQRPNQVVTFRVVAKAAGQNPIAVVVLAPSGTVIGLPQTIVVRSTAVNRIALLVTLGAAALLALLYLRRWLRRTKTPS
jgi:uncharacterized protein DUF6049